MQNIPRKYTWLELPIPTQYICANLGNGKKKKRKTEVVKEVAYPREQMVESSSK